MHSARVAYRRDITFGDERELDLGAAEQVHDGVPSLVDGELCPRVQVGQEQGAAS
ncbi:hypothetical protein GCM10010172_07620 [Paractinoplanes ferrugineus]|uniref:Uncharacterized protein n=1 Tax=Paractinoplanes ferrugineus TaxID=113564 RepID=A0A919JAS3_9ACTN|nr:hypothetical protein Afe05nite_87050 [Actinoplanes ferrugineus]